MNNTQIINQIETEINEIKNSIQHWKEIIQNHENTLLTLIKELVQIKQQINMNKNNQNSPQDSNNNK